MKPTGLHEHKACHGYQFPQHSAGWQAKGASSALPALTSAPHSTSCPPARCVNLRQRPLLAARQRNRKRGTAPVSSSCKGIALLLSRPAEASGREGKSPAPLPEHLPCPRPVPVCRETLRASPAASGSMRRWYQVPASRPRRVQP